MDIELANKVVRECHNMYEKLPKKGKPILKKEWTLLSSVVMTAGENITVVAMATGTKCLGRNEMSPRGDLINDSHAEVLARRCFLRYIYHQILKFKTTGSSEIIISCTDKNQYEINPKIKFHFYSSHVPCGDASIIPKNKSHQEDEIFQTSKDTSKRKISDLPNEYDDLGNKRKKVEEENKPSVEQTEDEDAESLKCLLNEQVKSVHDRFEDINNFTTRNVKNEVCNKECNTVEWSEDCVGEVVDIHRTGAKCVGTDDDGRLPGALYHTVGAVRTKPGRGDPTLSVSCSDKMARWIACGIQGALLSLLLTKPLYLSSVVIGAGGPYSEAVLRRAILHRSATLQSPCLVQSVLVFPHSRYMADLSARPCPSAVLWTLVDHKPLEVCVQGRREGTTKKSRDNGRLMVCKLELLRAFLAVSGDRYHGLTYRELKASADLYNSVWAQTKSKLGAWTTKPEHLEDFYLTQTVVDSSL